MPVVVAFETLAELYYKLGKKYSGTGKTIFARKPGPNEKYETITWDQVSKDVEKVAAYLLYRGVKPGDRVAILSENRYEWVIVDLAIQITGAINVSLYTSLPPAQCEYILNDSGAKTFFVSTGIQLKKAVQVFDNCPELEEVIAFDSPKVKKFAEPEYVHLYADICNKGESVYDEHKKEIKHRSNQLSPESVSTLIYTSGTTGNPKGAMLTHHNIVSNVKAAHKHLNIDETDRALSFLPLSHSFERTAGYYAMLAGGAEIYFAESVDTVSRNMVEASPTIMMSVPRLFEKMYNLITKSIEEGSAARQAIFDWALDVGRKYASGKRGFVSLQKAIADKMVFDKLKQRTGGRIKFFVSGGAALPSEINQFFSWSGLTLIQGYGLTETSPIMCANTPDDTVPGTVGTVISGVTVGIQSLEDNSIIAEVSGEDYPTNVTSDEGEILCKGPNVMKGYWKNEEATKEMIDADGWLHTGDVGRFVDGRLQITDRIKHMIVNAGGKNIYPGPIEDLFKTSKWIDQLVVVGEGQSYMAALIVPDFEVLEQYAKDQGWAYNSTEELLKKDEVKEIYKKEIRSISNELASHEKIRDFRLIANEFSVETGELTPTLKVKRRVINDKYGHLIEDIFSDDRA